MPYNKLLAWDRTEEYWPSVVFVRTSLRSVRTATTSGQYSPVRPSRSVSKKLEIYLLDWILSFERDSLNMLKNLAANFRTNFVNPKSRDIRVHDRPDIQHDQQISLAGCGIRDVRWT